MIDDSSNNIIPIGKAKRAPTHAPVDATHPEPSLPGIDSHTGFESVIVRNKQNRLRLQEERSRSNKAVLRSYRIK